MQISEKKLNNTVENLAKSMDRPFSEERMSPANKMLCVSRNQESAKYMMSFHIYPIGRKVNSDERWDNGNTGSPAVGVEIGVSTQESNLTICSQVEGLPL